MHDLPRSLFLTTVAAAIVGCGGSSAPSGTDLLTPPPTGQGVQYQMTTTIDPGAEVQRCKFVQAPAEGLHVNRDEVAFTAGSHHFLLYETSYTTVPTKKDDGTPVDTSGVFDCTSGPTQGWSVTRLVGGSQNGKQDAMLSFPPDVALNVQPNAVLLMNAHYINTTSTELTPDVRINLWTVPASQVKQEGDILFLYNIFIKAPALGMGEARMRCPVYHDITLTNFQSHMHSRGVGYEAALGTGAPFYTNTQWENVPVEAFPSGMTIKAGSTIDYACHYQNGASQDVYQGPSTKDEMCMAIGSFYPADHATSNCSSDPMNATGTTGLGAEWVGNGTATCAVTASCMQQAFSATNVMKSLTDCVNASDPSVSKEVSDLFRCIALNQDPLTACQTQISACTAK